MIDLGESVDTDTTLMNKRHWTSGTLIATAASILGVLLIVFGLTGLGLFTTTQQTPQTVTADVTSETAGVPATVTAAGVPSTSELDDEPSGLILTDVSQIAADVVDSVVTVEAIDRFRGRELVIGTGSGVIVGDDGTIVTNAHVVESAERIIVVLADGSEYHGIVLEVNVEDDLAAIDIDATNLNSVDLGSTDELAVGDGVIAVGYPLGLEGLPSVSTGIVSALNRTLEESDVSLTGVIQTDAAITEGSSGGALFDDSGRLIGITTAVGVSSVGIEGIGFAIPVESFLDSLTTLDGI